MKKEWFAEWFDSPYYHLLYKSRDEKEAKHTIDNLLKAVDVPPGARVLDLACGKGRHARYLAEKGFRVTGLDISEKSIAFARKFESENLEFFQHDMRKPFRTNYFDGVMNMFTSFGYFKTEHEHQASIQNIANNLQFGGLFLLDFFNSNIVRKQLVPEESKTIENTTFHLTRHIDGLYVYKNISFEAGERHLEFTEAVRLYELVDFQQLFQNAGLTIKRIFGDYELNAFDPEASPRLIMVAEKTL